MAQFDVYKNSNSRTKKIYPYLLDIQNSIVSDISTRIVIPLGNSNQFNHQKMDVLTPELSFNNEKLILLTPQIASIPAHLLKEPIGSFIQFRGEIISSLDFIITGA